MPFAEVLEIVPDIAIQDIRRAHQAVLPDRLIAREMMEHQDALAETVRPQLETGAVGGERIVTAQPRPVLDRGRDVRVVLAIVKHDFEHPVGSGQGRVDQA